MDTNGYRTEIDYNYGYFREQSPLAFRFACLLQGVKPPEIRNACELGYGNGMNININASASNIQWYGTDFNVSQANFASDLANISGNNAKLFSDSFEEFFHRTDLPDFDFICFHGVYSWVNEKNRDLILKFVDKKLRAGGAVYASYNVFPGFANLIPFRGFLKNVANYMVPKTKNPVSGIGIGFELFDKLSSLNANFIANNPRLKGKVEQFKKMSGAYLIHEFMNDSWDIMDFLKISESFKSARLKFLSSANIFSILQNTIIFTPEQNALLNSIEDIYFKEYLKDLIHNTSFRKDYWLKGAQRLSVEECQKRLKEIRVILTVPKDEVNFSIELDIGKLDLKKEVYEPLLDILGDHTPKTIGQIEQELKGKFDELQGGGLIESLMVLNMLNILREVQDDKIIQSCLQKTYAINKEILQKAKISNNISYLASAAIGEGIEVAHFEQLFLSNYSNQISDHKEYAKIIWKILDSQGNRIIKDGKTLQTAEENLKELEELCKNIKKRLPIYKNLKILEGI
ncbi:methyltransferase regulatory domain-containing protein [Helicobacter sp. 13S00477-4]|uniref:methyltransferase regulatory domain-containing protein n=1 Tax=Helicobacter sp. 13S00477-4 TaxID=1905759 RepID=UPI000BA5E3DB|nr:methyltransferase regulatory domain-containing protein [Helicobacter sp. 13S00477-4]PAF52298.1 hypothetical protein BKH44_03050 [Helicobacter sp. 13S00477-4]